MSNYYLTVWIFCCYLFRTSTSTGVVKVIRNATINADRPVLHDFTGGQLEQALEEAFFDTDDDDETEARIIDQNDTGIEEELQEASQDDAYVPSSLTNSIFPSPESDDIDSFMDSLSITSDNIPLIENIALNRVTDGEIPSGIDVHNYDKDEFNTLIRLYQSNNLEDRKALFQFISGHTHNKLMNCAINFLRWMKNPNLKEPIFYRNCVPCTNTVDLNLQSLFNHYLHLEELKYYFVNTCNMKNEWISYASDMEYIAIDLKRHPQATFTDVIRQNLVPNYRYVFQGLVRSEFAHSQRQFFHACNLIYDEKGHIWIIDGQIERVFDFNNPNDIKELDQRYRSDYITRASTGLFLPPSLTKQSS